MVPHYQSMPRRTMLPYPSTSRRLCAATRCPKVTTVALVSILFACLFSSRTLLTNDQPTLNRVVNTAAPHTVLAPAVEVVKEIIDKSHPVPVSQRDTSDATHLPTNVADAVIENPPLSVEERPADLGAASSAGLQTDAGPKDLVGLIADAQEDQVDHAVSVDTTAESASTTLTTETVASGAVDAVAAETVDRTENTVSVTTAETIPTVEKTDEESLADAAITTLESASTSTGIESAERTDETETSDATGVVDGEVLATEKQKDMQEDASTATDTVASQSDPAGININTDTLSVEKQESADDAQIAREDIQAVDSEVVIAEKQKSAFENAEVGSVVDGEGTTTLVETAEKDVSETSETSEVETTDKQETEEAVTVEGAADTAERTETDPVSVTESVGVDGQEVVEAGLDAADKQDTVQSEETDTAEMISNSEKETETTEETVNDTEITAAEKLDKVELDTAVLSESEKENTEAADGAEVPDLSVTDKMQDEQKIVTEGEDINAIANEGDSIDAEDKQEQVSTTEAVTREDERIAESTLEGALGTEVKQESKEETSTQEVQGDYDLSHEERQGVQADEDAVEKADDETTEPLKDRRR